MAAVVAVQEELQHEEKAETVGRHHPRHCRCHGSSHHHVAHRTKKVLRKRFSIRKLWRRIFALFLGGAATVLAITHFLHSHSEPVTSFSSALLYGASGVVTLLHAVRGDFWEPEI